MFGSILSGVLSSVLGGGATGLFGVALQRFFDWLNVKANLQRDAQEQKFKLDMRDKDAVLMAQEWAGRTRVAQVEGETAATVSANAAFASSLFKEPERYAVGEAPKNGWGYLGWFLLVCTDVLRGIVRPGLTLYLCILTTLIWYEAKALIEMENLSPAEALKVLLLIVETILYLTTTCVTWWFGTRNAQSAPKPADLRRGGR